MRRPFLLLLCSALMASANGLTTSAQNILITDSNGRQIICDVSLLDSITFTPDGPALTLYRSDKVQDTWLFSERTLKSIQDVDSIDESTLYTFVGTYPQSALYANRYLCNRELLTLQKYTGSSSYSVKSNMGNHFLNCTKATSEQKEWLRDPTTHPDALEGFTRWSKKRVVLFPFRKPMPADLNQHSIGDCNTVSTLADMAYLYPRFIESLFTVTGNNQWSVKMFDPDGKRIEVGVDNTICCDNNSNIIQMTGKKNTCNWATLLEKAIAKWLTVYMPGTGLGGFGAEGMTPMLTGDGRSFSISPGKCSAEDLGFFVRTCLQHGLIVNGGFNVQGLKIGNHESITAHGHSLLLPNKEDALFAMRNPWGQGTDDHVMQIMNDGTVPQTVDIRVISPGIAAFYFDTPLLPYTPPKW